MPFVTPGEHFVPLPGCDRAGEWAASSVDLMSDFAVSMANELVHAVRNLTVGQGVVEAQVLS